MNLPNCPKCNSEYTYEDRNLYVCPECFFEWTDADIERAIEESKIRDAFGNELKDGDNVTIVNDLKVKGTSQPLKQGTIVRDIKLIEDTGDGHNISCKIDGFGNMKLKSQVIKKI